MFCNGHTLFFFHYYNNQLGVTLNVNLYFSADNIPDNTRWQQRAFWDVSLAQLAPSWAKLETS